MPGTVGTALTGEFGTLTLNANGTFSYTPNHNVVVGSQDVFTYTITDDDGTTSTSTLTITIGAGAGRRRGDFVISVAESALAPNGSGTHVAPDAATTTVAFTAGADDLHVTLSTSGLTTTMPGDLTIVWSGPARGDPGLRERRGGGEVRHDGGSTIAAGTTGSVTVTETLLAPIAGEGTAHADLGTVTVVGTDTVNPATVTDTVTANVVDDGPKANPDTATAADGGPALTVRRAGVTSITANDTLGADTPIDVTGVVATSNGGLAGHGRDGADGADGTLTLNANGTFSYAPNHNVAVGSQDVFTYTITDNDGTTSTSTLTITIGAGAPAVGGASSSSSVAESALAPNGSGAHVTPDAATTSVAFTAGADDLHVTLSSSALDDGDTGTDLDGCLGGPAEEIQGFQDGVRGGEVRSRRARRLRRGRPARRR